MADRHFGPEIVELDLGGDVVRDVKAATAMIIGTAPVHDVHQGDQVAAHVDEMIVVRRRADVAGIFGPHTAGYTLPWVLDAIFDQDKGKGVGTLVCVNVFDPAVHVDGQGDPDPSQVTNLDVLGDFDATGKPSGLKWAYACYQRFGFFPKFVVAPGFAGLEGVLAELQVINDKVRARSYYDAPAGVRVQDVLAARGPEGAFDLQTDSRRINIAYPHMRVVDTAEAGATRIEPYSARLLGVHLSSIMEHGYHHSPSNRPIAGIEGAAQEILYTPGQSDDDTQLLRGAGVVTCEERWGKGPHTSGNRSAAFPTDTGVENFIHAQLIADMLHEGVLFFLDEHKDRPASPARLDYIESLINAWGLSKTVGRDPALMGFRFVFDRRQTTPQSYADGHVYWRLDWMPVGVMEWLTVNSSIDLNMVRDPLGLSQAETAQPA